MKPQWTQPTLSQEEIKRNGGVPPPPQPVIPQDFTIQLYNPDQQITVTEKPGTWGGQPSYTFSMPQYTFRTPSVSDLDRQHNDPAADNTTPKINFVWRHEGKLSKDLTCFLIGKSTDTQSKKKGGKEPGIAVALFSAYRNLTIYEPNLYRVEMEDYKGLEIVLLVSATVIRDIYCGQMKDCFNVGEAPRKNSSGLMRRKSSPLLNFSSTAAGTTAGPNQPPRPPSTGKSAAINGLYGKPVEARPNTTTSSSSQRPVPPPPPDPRTQWEIEAETARLRAQAEAERRAEEQRRRDREKADEAEMKRIKKMLEAEEKELRRVQAQVDKETERLRKQYGDQSALLPLPKPPLPDRNSAPGFFQGGWFGGPSSQQPPPGRPVNAPQYMQPPYQNAAASQSSFFHGPSSQQQPGMRPKKSFWGLRGPNEEDPQRLQRKKSSVF